MKRHLWTLLLAAGALFAACDDTTDTIGRTVIPASDSLTTRTGEYPVASRSVTAGSVICRSRYAYVGKVKDSETDSYFTANFMTQLLLPEVEPFFPLDTVYAGEKFRGKRNLTTAERMEKLDSLMSDTTLTVTLHLFYSSFYGDSLANMKLVAHEMDEPYSEAKTYYTTFNPADNGMVRTASGSVHKALAYSASNRNYEDGETGQHTVTVNLDDPYTDKDGKSYRNYGAYLLYQYYNEDAPRHGGYRNEVAFRNSLCPGFFLENTGGVGSLLNVYSTILSVNMRLEDGDSVTTVANLIGGTEEVMQMTNIEQDTAALAKLAGDPSCTYVKSPAGIFTELTLPVDDIMAGHDDDTLNTARVFLPRLNNIEGETLYTLDPPSVILMLPKDSLAAFFTAGKVSDNVMSYLASYSSGKVNGYTFSNISPLVTSLYRAKKTSGLTDAEYAARHPDWNKVLVIPVETSTSTTTSGSSVLTKVNHQMSLASTRLAKGTAAADSPIKINVIYSSFRQNE